MGIGDECSSETKGFHLGGDITQPFNKIIPVLIIWAYPPTRDSTNNNMMEDPGASMWALSGILSLYLRTLSYENYNLMGVPKRSTCGIDLKGARIIKTAITIRI